MTSTAQSDIEVLPRPLSGVRRVTGNALSVLTSDVVNRATTFVLYALVARFLGAFHFGQMSIALTLFYTFRVFASMGLQRLVAREVSRDPAKTDSYLMSGTVVVTVASVLCLVVLWGLVRVMGYVPETASVVLLLGLGLLPVSLSSVCEGIFQAREQMHFIAWANVPVNVVKLGLIALMLRGGIGLPPLIGLLVLSFAATAALEWWLMVRYVAKPRLRVDAGAAVAMVKAAATFFGIDAIVALWSSLAVVVLSKAAGEEGAGYYSAAMQLLSPMSLVFESVTLSVFPMMCKAFEPSFQRLQRLAQQLTQLMVAMALPVVLGVYAAADWLLVLLYGRKDYSEAATTLRIVVWSLLLVGLSHVFGHVLMASGRERISLRVVVVDAIVNLVLTVTLVHFIGLPGAALAALLTRVVDLAQNYVPVARLAPQMRPLATMWQPLVAGLGMGLVLLGLRGQHPVAAVAAGSAVYLLLLGGLLVLRYGGPSAFRARFVVPLATEFLRRGGQ